MSGQGKHGRQVKGVLVQGADGLWREIPPPPPDAFTLDALPAPDAPQKSSRQNQVSQCEAVMEGIANG